MAIAYDNSASNTTSTNSVSVSLATSGSDQIIFIGGFYSNTSTTDMTATVDGNAATKIATSQQASGDANKLFLFYYLNGNNAGAHTVALSTSSSGGNLQLVCASYTGVNQSGQPDASITSTTDGVNSKTQALTTIGDNCWLIMVDRWQNGSGSTVASTGSTTRTDGGGLTLLDSNGAKSPAGSYSMAVTRAAGSGGIGIVMASFKPISTSSASSSVSSSASSSSSSSLSPSSSVSSSISKSPSSSTSSSVSPSPSSSISSSASSSLSVSSSVSSSISKSPSSSLSVSSSISSSVSSSLSVSSSISASPSPSSGPGFQGASLYYWDGGQWISVDVTGI